MNPSKTIKYDNVDFDELIDEVKVISLFNDLKNKNDYSPKFILFWTPAPVYLFMMISNKISSHLQSPLQI